MAPLIFLKVGSSRLYRDDRLCSESQGSKKSTERIARAHLFCTLSLVELGRPYALITISPNRRLFNDRFRVCFSIRSALIADFTWRISSCVKSCVLFL